VVRAQEELFGPVASDPTVSRLIDRLAADAPAAVTTIRAARAAARAASWEHRSPVPAAGLVPVDRDGSVLIAHSEKEAAAPTFTRTFGFHPLLAFVDHTPAGTGGGGEPLAGLLRPNANANTATDHITVLTLALAQLPEHVRNRVLVRADSGGGTKAFLGHITQLGLKFSIGIGVGISVDGPLLAALPARAWTPAYDSDGQPRDGAEVAELTGLLPELTGRGWPAGMRVIARRERPHPGAQLRLTDADGGRITIFATNSAGGQLADLEVRHRLRARAEDRIRVLKDSGLRNLPLHDFTQNQIWLDTVLLAGDLLAWTATLGLTAHRAANRNGYAYGCSTSPPASSAPAAGPSARCPPAGPGAPQIAAAHTRLRALPAPG